MMLDELCRWAGVVLSVASACFWFAASITKATKADDSIGIESIYKDKKKGREIYINATAKKQAKLNAIAAFLIGLAIFFQVLPSILALF